MKLRGTITTAMLGAALLGPPEAAAQTDTRAPSFEFGIDASYLASFPDGGDRLTAIEIPLGRVRLGVFTTPRILIEVAGGFAFADQSDRSASAGRAEGAVSYHFGSDARRTRFFLLAGGGGRWASADESSSGQPFVTGGAGVKIPVNAVIGVRIEGNYGRAFSTGELVSAHEARGLIGMSFFVGG